MSRRLPAEAADAAVAIPPFTAYLHLVSVNPAENRARFYRLQWQPTLWGELALLCIWGRIGTLGKCTVLSLRQDDDTAATIAPIIRERLQHGYQVIAWR